MGTDDRRERVKVLSTEIEGVLEIVLDVHRDARGWLIETFRASTFERLGLPHRFVQDNAARSTKHALRGLHFQRRPGQAKLVRVTRGAAFDVAVDVRAGSPSFGRFVARRLEEGDGKLLFLPAGFAHGYQALSDDVEVSYKLGSEYDPGDEAGLAWDDAAIGIPWPLGEPVLSPRDRGWPRLAELDPWRPP
jgi:dTDP-4-dehydrorhamnose 3,5-epimerase